MALIPVTIFGQQFTSVEHTFLAGMADLSVAQGDIYYINSSLQAAVLAPGASGTVLSSQGAGADPQWISAGGTGTVTTVSVASANGFAGTVANATTTPAITISTSITGTLYGNGTAISAGKVTLTQPATGSTLTISDGKTLTALKTMSFTAADDTGVYTLPTGTVTLVGTGVATLSSLTSVGTITTGGAGTGFVIAGVTMTLGSDASYDLYYRGATGVLTRLANGTTGQTLTATTSNAPSWGSAGGSGTVTTVSVATANGFSGTVANATSTPAITIIAGAIVPNTVVASDATTPHIDTTAGSTNTGYFLVNGKTNGSFKITTADSTAQAITLTVAAQTVGAATLTIPNMANVNKTVAWLESPSFTTPTLGVASATTINKVTLTAPATGSTLTIVDGKTLTISKTMSFTAADDTGAYTLPTGTVTLVGTGVATLSSLTSVGTITTGGLGTGATLGAVTVNIASSAVGDIHYLAASNVLTRLAAVATGQPLISQGTTTAPAWAGYTFSATAAQTYTFPGASATLGGLGTSQTWTGQNKFNNLIDVNNAITASGNAATVPVTSRLNTVTNNSAATLTITMTTTSAVDGQMTVVRILDATGVAQTTTWVNTENSTVAASVTSNGSTTLFQTVGFIYNGGTSKWRCIASA